MHLLTEMNFLVVKNYHISLGRDNISTKLDLPVAEKDFKLFPKESYEASISIRAYRGTIYDFTITLQDSYREISSKGNNLENVVATLNIAIEKLENHKVSFAGAKLRITLGILILFVFIVTSIFISLQVKPNIYWPIYITVLVLLQLILYVPNWSEYFPGFKASETGITILESFSPLLSLIGVVLALIIPIISYMMKPKKERESGEN